MLSCSALVSGRQFFTTREHGVLPKVRHTAFGPRCRFLSGLGLRYPMQMLPLLLFQFGYKVIWLIAIALPQWDAFKSTELAQAMLIGVIVDVIAIPWLYVFMNYALKRGERWTRKA